MIYPRDFESKIGFDTLRAAVTEKCTCGMGREEVANMAFSSEFQIVKNELESVDEMMRIISSSLPFPLGNIHDVIPYLKEIKLEGSYMSSERLFKLMGMFLMMGEVSNFFKTQREEEGEESRFPVLNSRFAGMSLFPALSQDIDRIVNKFGEIKDSASPRLGEIRMQMRGAQGSMQRAMRRIFDKAVAQGIVDKDSAPSLRDGRMVIPVAAGNKRAITGIIHDESATGKTVFIEPSEVVEAGNRLRELEMEERREIITILRGVADEIRPYIEDIAESCRMLGKLDFIRAKALFAIDLGAQMPRLESKPVIEWYHAEHPGLILALRPQGRKVVPLNLRLGGDQRILIISGPNAGGKSVCLKTTAVIQYMTQCGMMPTLFNNSHVGIFRNLFIDIGDEQSFENDLSTYSSHLKNMKYFLSYSGKGTLFLADEMGSGTEPMIGGAIAQSILTELGQSGAIGIVTTHYQNLKTFAENESGFVNGAMLYDRQHLAPTFELSVGTPGSSFALDIAGKIGLPRNVIEQAKEIVGSDYVNLDKYLSEISRDRRYWANKRQSIREKENKLDTLLSKYEESESDLRSQRKEIINDAKREAKEILAGVNAKIERTILEIRKAEAEKEKTKQLRQELGDFRKEVLAEEKEDPKVSIHGNLDKLREKLGKGRKGKSGSKNSEANKPKTVETLQVGDYVKIEGGSSVGQIIALQGKKAEVAFGAMRTFVELKRLQPSKKEKETLGGSVSSISTSTLESSRKRQLNFKNEIDVRGMRADEALQAVTYFLDDAIQFGASRVRILHGTGHGILKTLIRQQLKANTAVSHFADEDVRFGGAGITVVDLG